MSITLKSKASNLPVHTMYIKYDYINSLGGYGWYVGSIPYKRGKANRLLAASTFVENLNTNVFSILVIACRKDAHIKSLHKLLSLWKDEIEVLGG